MAPSSRMKTCGPLASIEPAGVSGVAAVERGEDVSRGHAQRREAVVGELDEDPFRLLADDVHLLDARHVQQALAQGLRFADEAPMRLALRLQHRAQRSRRNIRRSPSDR